MEFQPWFLLQSRNSVNSTDRIQEKNKKYKWVLTPMFALGKASHLVPGIRTIRHLLAVSKKCEVLDPNCRNMNKTCQK